MTDPIVARTRDELTEALAQGENETAVVMTMGALHAGHRVLMRAAREQAGDDGTVIVTIFVNPLQFGPGEDFDRYPRAFDADLAACADEGVDVVFAPATEELYPYGEPLVRVDPGPLGTQLEGAVRPGHFAGVLTVVAKLLNLTVPHYALFGEKDYQQLTLIRRMVADLDLPYEILGVPTVREADGLALSSRNLYLSADERAAAPSLARALTAGADAAAGGPDAVLAAARAELTGVDVDYLELRGDDLATGPLSGPARLLVAARAGATRLIDNIAVDLP
ncbi:pantoate--beta-alanine ligase [Jiangella anatolica]|uniref:Pantothenate synthetase n=1 Tax=Jiangella anatolica TaxID=2670374 RepID=A0A2W2BH59_9ACTN|nr:pantoate--beta-alanine ligase [Jiangella anatolica]PZF85342.1 pantoate--beta-alanine ligase [Jiangella anatolica]